MARIRTIKPEFWTSSQIVECSPSARLAFVGMWNFCDDGGVHVADCRRLKMEVFPGDDITVADVQRLIDELMSAGLLDEYEVGGQKYWEVTGWRHQKIERPTFKHPKRPKFGEASRSNHRALAEHSEISRRGLDDSSPPEGKGKDVDADVKGSRRAAAAELSVDSETELMNSVLDAYQKVYGVRPPGGHSLIQLIQQRVTEYEKASESAWWVIYFQYTNRDSFLAGNKNPEFKATLFYLLKPDVFARVVEAAQREEISHG